MFWKKISTKLYISFLATLSVAIFVTNFFSYWTARNNLQSQILDNISLIADFENRDLNDFLRGARDRATDFSSDGFIRDSLVQIESGRGVPSDLDNYLIKNKLLIDPNLKGITILDLNGIVVASTFPNEIGTNHSTHEHFMEAKKLAYGVAYSSDVFFDKNIDVNTAFITAAAPLFDRAGKNRIGVIENLIDVKKIDENIRASIGTRTPFEADRLESAKSFETLITDKTGLSLTELKYAPGSFLKKKINTLPIQNCAKGLRTSQIFSDYRGVAVAGASLCLQYGWVLVVKLDASEAFAVDAIVANLMILISSAAMLILCTLIYLFVKTITKPIDKLRIVVEKFGGGDLSQRADIKSDDEIGEFGKEFNEMAENIQSSHEGLEKRILEKTSSLNSKVSELTEAQRALINVVEDLNVEKELVGSEKARAEALLESMGDGVIAIDRDKKIIYTNPAADKMFGWNGSDVVGKFYYDIWDIVDEAGETASQADRPMNLAFSEGKITSTRTYYRSFKNNKKVPVAATITPIILDNKTVGVINVIKDIAHEMEVDRAKTEFVSIASHQLRTPLTAIKWYTEMLLEKDTGKLTKKQHEYLDEIYAGNQRMVTLVGALLNVSRIDMGTFAIEPELADVVKIADSVLTEMTPDIEKKKLEVIREYDKSMPLVSIDIKLVRIIIQNFLSNSVKYTPSKGKITLSIAKENRNFIIKVKDTGYGIPKEAQSKIFTKLFRADNVRIKDPEGTGLGLYIVKAIVAQSGGKIWFESEENKGTTFYISLPLSGMKKKSGTKELIN